jgi:hypothetical protein
VQGDTSIEDVLMIREGRIQFTSNRTGQNVIYSSNYDGTDQKQLSDQNQSVTAFNVVGDKIYYHYSSGGKQRLNSMNLDGSEKKILQNDITDQSYSIYFKQNRAFYKPLYQYKDFDWSRMDGSGKERILPKENTYTYSIYYSPLISEKGDFFLMNSYIYDYSKGYEYTILYLDPKNKTINNVYSNSDYIQPYDISVDDKWFLFKVDEKLFEKRISSGDAKEIGIANGFYYKYGSEDSIIFMSFRDSKLGLYTMKRDGTDEQLLMRVDSEQHYSREYFWDKANNLIQFYSNGIIYLLDPNFPQKEFLVTDEAISLRREYSSN